MLQCKCVAILIKFLVSIALIDRVDNYRVGSRCGFPGVPHDTKIEPSKRIYEDGEEITYRCPKDDIYIKTQMKKCVMGEWIGSRSTCGHFIVNQLKQVRIVNDESSSEKYGTVIYDDDVSNFTATNFPASFFDKKASKVVVSDANRPHKWYLHFTNPLAFDFFLLNVRTPKTKTHVFDDLIDNVMVKSIRVENEPERNCTIDFSTRLDYSKVFWIWCTKSSHRSNQSTIVTFVSYSNQKLQAIALHHTYFTRLYYCGRPEVPLLGEFVNNGVQCDPRIAIDVSDDAPSAQSLMEEDSCVDNSHWAGYPKCMPKVHCVVSYNKISESIVSVYNAFKFNQTEWHAIEDTIVEYKCTNGYELAANSRRVCRYNGSWDQNGPICVRQLPTEQSAKQVSSTNVIVWIVIAVFLLLAIIAALVMYFMCRYNKLKRETIRSITEMKKADDEYYEDVEVANYYAQVSYSDQPLQTYDYPQLSEVAKSPQISEKPYEYMQESSSSPTTTTTATAPVYLPVFDENYSNVYIQMSKK